MWKFNTKNVRKVKKLHENPTAVNTLKTTYELCQIVIYSIEEIETKVLDHFLFNLYYRPPSINFVIPFLNHLISF